MTDEHKCFEIMIDKYGDTSPFERPVVIDNNLDFKALTWHVNVPGSKRTYRLSYCPFCGERFEHDD